MRSKLLLVGSLCALLSGCVSVAEQRESDRRELQGLLRERVGADWAAAEQDEAAVAAELEALLAAPLSEYAAVEIALLNNAELRAHLAELGVASAEVVQAGRWSNPVFSANAKFFGRGTEFELGIAESVFDVFSVGARRRLQAARLEGSKARIARALVDIVFDLRRAFNGLRAAQRRLELERENERAARGSAELMLELHRAGNVVDPALTAEQLAHTRAQRALAQAALECATARERLALALGLGARASSWTIEAGQPEDLLAGLDLEQLEARALAASLELAELRAAATADARRAGLADWEAVFAGDSAGLSAKQEAGSSEWGLGPALGFSLPIFDAGDARSAALAAQLEHTRAQHIAVERELRSAARRLGARVRALHEQAQLLRDQELPQAAQLLRETLRNYNAMQIGAFDVLAAKRVLSEISEDYVQTLRDGWAARLDLEQLLAGSRAPDAGAHEPAPADPAHGALTRGSH